MNGYSILFAVLVIVSLAIIIGTIAYFLVGGLRQLAVTPWHRHRAHHHR